MISFGALPADNGIATMGEDGPPRDHQGNPLHREGPSHVQALITVINILGIERVISVEKP